MSSLTIADLDEATLARLRERAATHGRTPEVEAKVILTAALQGPAAHSSTALATIRRRLVAMHRRFRDSAQRMPQDREPSVELLIERALAEVDELIQNPVERECYEARLKGLRDFLTGLAEAHREGYARGRRRALRQTSPEGEREGLVGLLHLCERLRGRAPTPPDNLRHLSLEELEEQVQRLEAELTGPSGSSR